MSSARAVRSPSVISVAFKPAVKASWSRLTVGHAFRPRSYDAFRSVLALSTLGGSVRASKGELKVGLASDERVAEPAEEMKPNSVDGH